jgi:hypothetical protein
MLFMLELVLAVRYFQHSSRPLLHRAGIGAMIASDILCTFTICAKIYLVVSLYPSGPPHGFPEFTLQTTEVHGYPGSHRNLTGWIFNGSRRVQMPSIDTAGLMHQFERFPADFPSFVQRN